MYVIYVYIFTPLRKKKKTCTVQIDHTVALNIQTSLFDQDFFFFLSAYRAKRLFVMFTYMHEDFNDRFIQQ